MSAAKQFQRVSEALHVARRRYKLIATHAAEQPVVDVELVRMISQLGEVLREASGAVPRCTCGAVTERSCVACYLDETECFVCERPECLARHARLACGATARDARRNMPVHETSDETQPYRSRKSS